MTYVHVTLVAGHDSADNLADFSQAFFHALDITDYEERESSNNACGGYYLGHQDSIEINIMESGDIQQEVLPFWVDIYADEDTLYALVEQHIHKRLLPEGFMVTQILDLGKPSERRVHYGTQSTR